MGLSDLTCHLLFSVNVASRFKYSRTTEHSYRSTAVEPAGYIEQLYREIPYGPHRRANE